MSDQIDIFEDKDRVLDELEDIRDRVNTLISDISACPDFEPLDSELKGETPRRLVVQGADFELTAGAWCDLLEEVADFLADWHRKRMMEAADQEKFGSTRKSYISNDDEDFLSSFRAAENIYIETKLDTNTATDFISSMLDQCGYDPSNAYVEVE